ncbi:MAG TPA: SDR family NAD(P)-dependent oxidoreductase [Acetobacteraceae bacterium]|jgi:NAD(P)-dependent dehydrogenase (short-subunit alcohol dehydrogenase family)
MQNISGKVAFVTGAANGIGLGICRALARAGAHVALADIQPDALERACSEIAALGVRAIALTLDVSDADAVARAADAVEAEFGKVHIVCNNAGISLGNVRLLDMTRAQWDWIFGVNVFGVVNGVQVFVPRILRHGEGGHIVNTASMAGLQVNPNIPGIGAYAMTKHGVIALSEALAMELRGSGVGISVLCPAQVETTLYDSGRRRPDRFGGSYQRADLDQARARSSTGLSADAVGKHVVHAIRHDEYFIFTHPEARDRVEERHARMMAGFDAARRYPGG